MTVNRDEILARILVKDRAPRIAQSHHIPPSACDHAGSGYSSTLAVLCDVCGARMILPPRHMAHRGATVLSAMYVLWTEAGWPEFLGGEWIVSWSVQAHPLFAQVGGIPVLAWRVVQWRNTWGDLNLDEWSDLLSGRHDPAYYLADPEPSALASALQTAPQVLPAPEHCWWKDPDPTNAIAFPDVPEVPAAPEIPAAPEVPAMSEVYWL